MERPRKMKQGRPRRRYLWPSVGPKVQFFSVTSRDFDLGGHPTTNQ